MVKDYYAVLGVPLDAGQTEIKAAFRRSILSLHPDKMGNVETAKDNVSSYLLVQEAWQVLSNPVAKIAYDKELKRCMSPAPVPIHEVLLFSELKENADNAHDGFNNDNGNEDTCWKWPCRCGGEFVVFQSDIATIARPLAVAGSEDVSSAPAPCDIVVPCTTCSLHVQIKIDE
jgi:curved DNA-binding protein CbpA